MRPTPWTLAEQYRLTRAPNYESQYGDPYGFFEVPINGIRLICMAGPGCDEVPWEHVSVSSKKRVPNWYEMALVKHLFWLEDETVMQLHVPLSMHVNLHPHTLHLWRPINEEIPLPPLVAV